MSQPSARPSAVIVLAAGQGTRMKSTTPKIMHAIGGRSLVGHALAAAWSLAPEHLVAVVRHERARVAEHLETVAAQLGIDALAIADQDDVPGTGRAVELGLAALPALQALGLQLTPESFGWSLLSLTISQMAPILPYLFLVLMLIFRPKGLMGTRED